MSYSDIKDQIKKIIGIDAMYLLPIPGTVISVGSETCTVKIDSGLEIPEVRMKAFINNSDSKLLIVPKVGSRVQCLSLTGNLNDITLIQVDEPELIACKLNDLSFVLDGEDNKVSISNQSNDLLGILEDLSGIIKQLTVSTGVGPSGTPLPPTIASLNQWEAAVKTLIK